MSSSSPHVRRRVLAGGSLALAALLGAAGWWLFAAEPRRPAVEDAPAESGTERSPAPPSNQTAAPLRVRGRVLAPDGTVAEGADVALFRLRGGESVLPSPADEVWRTDGEGRFEFEVARGPDLAVGARMQGHISMLVPVVDARRELVLRLADAYDVHGYVSEYFAPVEGCEVVLEAADGRFSRVTRTGPDGAFRFSEIYPGLVTVAARTPLYRPATRTGVVVGSGEPLRLQFREPALGIAGRVWLDDQGTVPAAGAVVRASLQRTEPGNRRRAVPHEALVRADGTFRLLGLGSGMHRVEIAHPERSTEVRVLDVDATADVLDVRLAPRVAVRGRLVESELVSTELLLVTEADERMRTRTDTGGRFEFAATCSVGPATLVLLERSLCFQRTSSRRIAIEAGSGEALVLSVAPAVPLIGEVVDPEGRKIAGAEVYVDSEHLHGLELLRQPAAVTDAEGRYQLHVASNANVELTFEHPLFATYSSRLARDASGQQQPVTLHPPSRIHGRVVRDGRPLPAAIVHLSAEGPVRGWATTGPDGSFVVHGVPPGEHELFVRHGTFSELSARARVQPGVEPEPLVLALPPVRTIEGRVVDGQRRPVAGVRVGVDNTASIDVKTDENGRFTLDVPQGEVVVRAALGWRLQEVRQVAANEHEVEIALPLPPHGQLLAEVEGLPSDRLRGALLTLEPEPGEAGPRVRTSHWVDVHENNLVFERMPAGRWLVEIRCSGYTPWVTRAVLAPGETVDLGRQRLEPGARLRGIVQDENGRPVGGARVLLGDEDDALVVDEVARLRGEDPFGVRTDVRGRFELMGVSFRSATLVVQARGYASQQVNVRIPTDLLRRDPLVVTLTTGVDIVAQVLDAAGQPAAGRMVQLSRNGFAVDVGRTDAEGRCAFQHRSSGEYRLDVLGTTVGETVDVLQRQTYHVPLRLGAR